VEMKNNRKFMKHVRRICQEYTKLPADVIEKLLQEDVNLSASKCLRYGIVEEVI
jgi:ATP-dependent protease ClpP protease subunit